MIANRHYAIGGFSAFPDWFPTGIDGQAARTPSCRARRRRWLALGHAPPGSIVLVHPNGNEEAGLRFFRAVAAGKNAEAVPFAQRGAVNQFPPKRCRRFFIEQSNRFGWRTTMENETRMDRLQAPTRRPSRNDVAIRKEGAGVGQSHDREVD